MTNPRPKLRALREERGWTQQDVADQVARMAWLREHKGAGVNADMVAKWERGDKRPNPRYRELLGQVFNTDPTNSDSAALPRPGPACTASLTATR